METLEVYKCGVRYKTALHKHADKDEYYFCTCEKTAKGILITEFDEKGEPINQVYTKYGDPESILKRYVLSYCTVHSILVKETPSCEKVRLKVLCTNCNRNEVYRELDLVDIRLVGEIPVVPIFRCGSCGKRYYSLSDTYLKKLVDENRGLFENDEIKMREDNEKLFINTLNDNIIRIFASKKISRISVK